MSIYLKLIWAYLKIGIFGFGGGYPPPSCTHAQSCNPMDYSPPSSVHGFSRQEYCSGLPFPSPKTYFLFHMTVAQKI